MKTVVIPKGDDPRFTILANDIEVVQHDLALLAHLVSLIAANVALEATAKQAQKIADFYTDVIDNG